MKKFIVKVVEYSFAVLLVFWEESKEFIERIMTYGLILLGMFWIYSNMSGYMHTFELPEQNESVGGVVCVPFLDFSSYHDPNSGTIKTFTTEVYSKNSDRQIELELLQNSLVTIKNLSYRGGENFTIIKNNGFTLTAIDDSGLGTLVLDMENAVLVIQRLNFMNVGSGTFYFQCNKFDLSSMEWRDDFPGFTYDDAPKACGSWGVPALGEMVRDPRFGLFKLDPYLVISNNKQNPIWATADGFVEIAYQRYPPYSGLGNYVVIDHGSGIKSRYAHAEKLYVNEGDFVKQGQAIGMMGLSGDNFEPSDYSVRYECFDGEEKISPFKCLSSSFLRTIDGNGLEDEVCFTEQEG